MNLKMWIGPLVGAIIGLCTNYIAVLMLFHPKNEIKVFGHVLPFSPGAIPKEKNRIARTIGDIVAKDLLTNEDIENRCLEAEDLVIDKILTALEIELKTALQSILKSEDAYDSLCSHSKEKIVSKVMSSINEMDIEKLLMKECMEVVDQKLGDSAILRFMSGSVVASLSTPVSNQISIFINGTGKEMLEEKLNQQFSEWESVPVINLINQFGLSSSQLEKELRDTYKNIVHQIIPSLMAQLNVKQVVEEKICAMSNDELEAMALKAMKKEFTLIVYLGGIIGFLLGCIQLLI